MSVISCALDEQGQRSNGRSSRLVVLSSFGRVSPLWNRRREEENRPAVASIPRGREGENRSVVAWNPQKLNRWREGENRANPENHTRERTVRSVLPILESAADRMNNFRDERDGFIVDQVLHANIVDLSKKRKLIDTQLSLPIRKLNFREESLGSEESSNYSGEPVADDVLQALFTKASGNLHQDDEMLQPDSEMDSNSFLEESEGAISESTEAKSQTEISKVSTYNHPVKSKRDISEVYACDEASSSSGSFSSNYTKDVLCSIDHRSFKMVDNKEKKLPVIDDQHLEFGYDAELKELLDTEPEDLMLYSNGMSSDLFVLSSGRWKIKQDSQAAIRKPTIDQEFEEYFSSLML